MPPSGASTAKRLLHELQNHETDPSPAIPTLGLIDESNLFTWHATLNGPPHTAYEGATFPLRITIPPTYPLAPPVLTFLAPQIPIHANVHPRTGEICLDLLKTAWSPAYTIVKTLEAVQQLLMSPEVDSPLNVDVAALLRQGDEVGAESLVRLYIAMGRAEG